MLSKSIKVLYPVLHYPPVIGGLEQWTKNIAERQRDDIEVIVITGRVINQPIFERIHNVTIFRTSLCTLRNLSHSSWLYIITAIPFIIFRSFMLAKAISFFHCQGFLSALMGHILSLLTGKPFIGTEQSLGWGEGKSKWLRGFIYRRAKLCIAASRAVADEFKKLGIREERIRVIPNGIDLAKFFPKSGCKECGVSDIPHRETRILSVGRLEKVKGHAYLIEAFALIKKEVSNTRLVLIGDGTERSTLQNQARELGVKESIEFMGEMPHDELPHYYHKADIFVMPSLSEGFGISAIEAMACGAPVIATNVGGLSDIIHSGENGLLVERANTVALAKAIIQCKDNVNLRLKIIREAEKTARDYSWYAISSRVAKLYAHALNTSGDYCSKNRWLFSALVFAAVNLIAIFSFLGLREYGDTQRYIGMINWFQGERNTILEPIVFLRPLGPILAIPMEFIGEGAGLILQNIIFYFLSVVCIFKIVDILFSNARQAFLAAVFFVTAAQVLETGIAYLTDMGPWFFYLFSTFLTLEFLKERSSMMLAPVGGFVAGLGFILKENGGLGSAFYGMMILLSKRFAFKEKILHILRFGLFFLVPVAVVNGLAYHYLNVTYIDWFSAAGGLEYKEELRITALRYTAQLFKILGILWPLVLLGLWMEIRSKNRERLKVYLALLPSSLSFLFWTTSAGGRSVFIFAPLGIMLATFGWMAIENYFAKVSLSIKKAALPALLTTIVVLNYMFVYVNQDIDFTDMFLKFVSAVL